MHNRLSTNISEKVFMNGVQPFGMSRYTRPNQFKETIDVKRDEMAKEILKTIIAPDKLTDK